MSSVHEEFLQRIEFSNEEIKSIMPYWEHTCRLLGLNDKDVRIAIDEWIGKYWDMSLKGVRQCIGAYVRELIELVRMKEYQQNGAKILYCNMPTHPACLLSNKIAGGDRLHIAHPDWLVTSVMSAFFNKPVTSEVEDSFAMNPSCRHCAMNQFRIMAQKKQIITNPDAYWNWGLCCNEGPKTEEMIRCLGNDDWHYVLTTLPHDVMNGAVEADDERRVEYLARQLQEAQKKISKYTEIDVSETEVIEAEKQYFRYLQKVDDLTDIVSFSDPQPIGGNDLTLFSAPTALAFDTGFHYLEEALDTLIEEARERVQKKEGPLPAGSPRLACHFVPYCVPWIAEEFKDAGINLSINTFFATAKDQMKYNDEKDIYKKIARQWFCNPCAVNLGNEAKLVVDRLERYPVDGVLYGFFSFDRWIGSLQKMLIKTVEERAGIPHFYLEGDFFDDSSCAFQDKKARIESIGYHVKIRKLINAGD